MELDNMRIVYDETSASNSLFWISDGELMRYSFSENAMKETKLYDVKGLVTNGHQNLLFCLSQAGALILDPLNNPTSRNTFNQPIEKLFHSTKADLGSNLLLVDSKSKVFCFTDGNDPEVIFECCEIAQYTSCMTFHVSLDIEGTLRTWGSNNFGQLGVAQLKSFISTPTVVPRIPKIKSFSCCISSTLALDYEGKIWSFGYNSTGQLGVGHRYNMDTPVMIEDIPAVKAIECTSQTCAALTVDNEVFVWGASPEWNHYVSPVKVSDGKKYIQIQFSHYRSALLMLDFDGVLWSFDGTSKRLFPSEDQPKISFRSMKSLNAKYCVLVDVDGNLYFIDWQDLSLHKTACPPFPSNNGKRTKSSRNAIRKHESKAKKQKT